MKSDLLFLKRCKHEVSAVCFFSFFNIFAVFDINFGEKINFKNDLFNNKKYQKSKLACSASGNGTCKDPFCFITPINSSVNAANFGCGTLTRPLNKVYVSEALKPLKQILNFFFRSNNSSTSKYSVISFL